MKILTAICVLLFLAELTFGQSAVRRDGAAAITAVTGESWLHHLHRSFDETSMGRTWHLGPPGSATDYAPSRLRLFAPSASTATGSNMETLHGSDLYRLNCQGCHGESGVGAPPEIGSLIDPVRATSTTMVEQRMSKVGMVMSRRQTAEMVNQSRVALLKRLYEGGQDMPSFHHLTAREIRSLVVYLQQLAGVPGASEEQVGIQESHARVGELIVKSTCHICHSATGANPTPAELSQGAIPPLSALPERVNEQQLVRKVTSGAPVITATTSSVFRGRMPVFSYLSENEAADIYEYLIAYPPAELAGSDHGVQAALLSRANPPADYRGERATSPQPAPSQASVPREQYESVVLPIVLPISAGLFAVVLILLGCWITWREFRRLSVESQARIVSRRLRLEPAPWVALRPPVELFIDSSRLRADRETSHKAG